MKIPLDLAQSDILRNEATTWSDRSAWPAWARKLTDRSRFSSQRLLSAVDDLVRHALNDASAVCTSKPYVRLKRIAKHLNATVQVRNERQFRGFGNEIGALLESSKQQRGILIRVGRKSWHISAGSRHYPATRYSVAHELAHALLYQSQAGIDVATWRSSQRSRMEEVYCNYMARAILAPERSLAPLLDKAENFALQIVTKIAGRFEFPLRESSLRWLDVASNLRVRAPIVILWRQYHPLDPLFVQACIRNSPMVRDMLVRFAKSTRGYGSELTFQEAAQLWREVITTNTLRQGERNVSDCYLSLKPILAAIRRFLAENVLGSQKDELSRLGLADGEVVIRPVWAVWHQLNDPIYIPYRGSARRESLVYTLANENRVMDAKRLENVNIGRLKGAFHVHAFASGDSRKGSRYVLAAYEER